MEGFSTAAYSVAIPRYRSGLVSGSQVLPGSGPVHMDAPSGWLRSGCVPLSKSLVVSCLVSFLREGSLSSRSRTLGLDTTSLNTREVPTQSTLIFVAVVARDGLTPAVGK